MGRVKFQLVQYSGTELRKLAVCLTLCGWGDAALAAEVQAAGVTLLYIARAIEGGGRMAAPNTRA